MAYNFDIDYKIKNFVNERKKSLSEFEKKGFPNKKIEEWKFTDLNKIIKDNFNKLSNKIKDENIKFTPEVTFEHNFITLVNGHLKEYNFDLEGKQGKNSITLKKINHDEYFKNIGSIEKNSMLNLNIALVDCGFQLKIDDNYNFKKPIVIYNYFTKNLDNKIINNSEIINLGKNAKVKVLELFINQNHATFFKNTLKSYRVSEDASLNYYFVNLKKNNCFSYNYLKADIFKNSNFENFIFSSGTKFLKSDLNINLLDNNSECAINSGLFLNKNIHQEIKTHINHLKPNTRSNQNIKKVLSSGSKGIFQGKIFVDSEAQKTNAYQISKGLILDEKSDFTTKPELEIYADDVKCSHGSASGSLNENSIFYLMSRGLNYQQSKELLINGFLLDVVEKITDSEIKNLIKNIIGLKE